MPEVWWQRGLNPRLPDQPAHFVMRQLAPPSHLCSRPRPLLFLGEPVPHPSMQPELPAGLTSPRHGGLASQAGERSLWAHVHRPGVLKEAGPEGLGG